jgi:uncharacterized membrane protein
MSGAQPQLEGDPSLFSLPPVRPAGPGAAGRWLAAGWRDYTATPLASTLYGVSFVVMGLALEHFLRDAAYLLGLITGFTLIAPFLAIGLYDLSRQRLAGQRPRLLPSLLAWRANFGQVLFYGVILALLFAAWVRVSVVIVALFFDQPAARLDELARVIVTTPEGWLFAAMYTAAGGAFAWLVYATSAVSVPMLLDRPVDALSAMITSFRAVRASPLPMLGWGLAIALLVALGMLGKFLPLAVIVPVIGHASWHCYLELVGPVELRRQS